MVLRLPFLVRLQFGNVDGLLGERKTGVPGEKPLHAKTLDGKMDLNKFASGTYAAEYKNWGVNLLQRRQIPHLPRYLRSLLFGMQMWHLPSLPHIYSTVLHFCDMFARSKFVQILFFRPVREFNPHMASTPGIWTRTTFGGRRVLS